VPLLRVDAIVRAKVPFHNIEVDADSELGLYTVIDIAASHALHCKSRVRWWIVGCRELDQVAPRRERPGKGWGMGQ
jgi:hypothetical protein